MEERMIKVTAFGGCMAMVLITVVMLLLPQQLELTTIIADNVVEQSVEEEKVEETTVNYYDQEVTEQEENSGIMSCLNIPLPENVEESDIVIEESYIDQMIKISINNIDTNFFSSNPLVGSSDHISDLVYGSADNMAQIELYLDSVYEYEAEFKDNQLSVKFIEPKSVYDKIVVIDPGHGSKAAGTVHNNVVEKEINLQIALKLKKLLDESDIKAYFTRVEDTNPTFEARANLANNTNADFFISIHNNSDGKSSKSSGTEVLYDELAEYSGFGTKELAGILQEELVSALGTRDRGITKGNSIYIIRNSKVPVALVEVGFITNKNEAAQLVSEAFQEKVAQAIFDGIVRAYEEKGNE